MMQYLITGKGFAFAVVVSPGPVLLPGHGVGKEGGSFIKVLPVFVAKNAFERIFFLMDKFPEQQAAYDTCRWNDP
jgi:hypothetical protein